MPQKSAPNPDPKPAPPVTTGSANEGEPELRELRSRADGNPRGIGGIPIQFDREAETPLPVQLAAALRDAIDAGTLQAGEPVSATRDLAHRLAISRGVVVAAYEQLIAEGYLFAERGRGTRVNPALRASGALGAVHLGRQQGISGTRVGSGAAQPSAESPPPSARSSSGARLSSGERPGPLAPGVPITDAVVGSAWRSAWRTAAAQVDAVAPPLGDPRLRYEIADHLRRMRATNRDAADVLVTAGTRDGLGLVLTSIGAARGSELVVGVEDPGLPSLRDVAARYGARILALPADENGLDTSALPAGVLDVVVVTPSHQYPLGGSLPLKRRRELLEWAASAGVIVIEDDFDSELRYTGSPLPTLAALDDPRSGSVVLLGTFSRTVAPALSAGYLLAPANLLELLTPVRVDLGSPVSGVVQAALAKYLATGELRRHTARMLRRYAARRDAVSDRLLGASGVRVRPMDGGLHAILELRPGARKREAAVLTAARKAGLGVEALGSYWRERTLVPAEGRTGLVIGMGGPDDEAFLRALGQLRDILDATAE